MGNTWSEQKERSNPFALKLIFWLALNTSRALTRLLLYPITFYFLLTAPRVRRASANYLRRIYHRPASITATARHIFNFAATILDRIYFLTDQIEKFDIRMTGVEVLDELNRQHQGCILLGAHVGSFDALRSLAVNRSNINIRIMMQHDHNAMMMRMIDSLNPAIAATVINTADSNALLKMKEALEAGEFVGMLGDRYIDNKYVTCRLLGSEVKMPTAPLILASILQVPVVLFFPLYLGNNRYEIYFEELTQAQYLSRSDRDKAVPVQMQRYADRLEHYIKMAPLNWFNFYDYWSDEN